MYRHRMGCNKPMRQIIKFFFPQNNVVHNFDGDLAKLISEQLVSLTDSTISNEDDDAHFFHPQQFLLMPNTHFFLHIIDSIDKTGTEDISNIRRL
jgi:hypothetical protein